MPENIESDEQVNLDEVHENNNDNDEPHCPDSPSGEHEFDTDEESGQERCVYCSRDREDI